MVLFFFWSRLFFYSILHLPVSKIRKEQIDKNFCYICICKNQFIQYNLTRRNPKNIKKCLIFGFNINYKVWVPKILFLFIFSIHNWNCYSFIISIDYHVFQLWHSFHFLSFIFIGTAANINLFLLIKTKYHAT